MPKAKARPCATANQLAPGRVQARVYANDDDTYLVWEVAPIPQCRGFAIYRRVPGGAPDPLENRVGWRGEKRDPKRLGRPSTEWPFQTFTWSDFKARSGQVLSYQVVPMVGPDRRHLKPAVALASEWTGEIKVTAADPAGGLAAFFNRGIVASQWLARVLGDPKKAGGKLMDAIAQKGNVTRNFLAGDLRVELLKLLSGVTADGGHVFAALYELNDPELVAALVKLGTRAHVVLANGSQKRGEPDPFADERVSLRTAGVDLHDRMAAPRFNAHNKFLVLCDGAQKPLSVWTGSTNWTITGLCTQANNGLLIDDPTVAAAYKSRWRVVRDAGDAVAPATTDGTRYDLGGARSLTLWFTPVKALKDLAAGRALIAGARQGVLFLMFNPGPAPESLLKPILDLIDPKAAGYRPDLYVAGAVNQDPGGKNPIILVNHGEKMTGPVEIVLPANIRRDFSWWVPELLKAPAARAMVHSKVVVIDPFGHHPVVITGSHNLSKAASGRNDENLVIVEHDHDLAVAYAVTIQAIYKQYRFRHTQVSHEYKGLEDDDVWQRSYMSPRRMQERRFWMQELRT